MTVFAYDSNTVIFANNPSVISESSDVFLHETGHAVVAAYDLDGDRHVAHHFGLTYTGTETGTHTPPNALLVSEYNKNLNFANLNLFGFNLSIFSSTSLDSYYTPNNFYDTNVNDERYLDESAVESFASYYLGQPPLSNRQPGLDNFWRQFSATKGW